MTINGTGIYAEEGPQTALPFVEPSGQRGHRGRRSTRCGPHEERAQQKRNNDEATKLYSVAGLLFSEVALVSARPFRPPPSHHLHRCLNRRRPAPPRQGEPCPSWRALLRYAPEFSRDALEVLCPPKLSTLLR